MKKEIKIPEMGESIVDATIGAIVKPTGSHVEMDEGILELETDKVNQLLPAPETGVLTLTVKTGDVVEIGKTIGFIDTEAESKKEEKLKEEKPQEEKPKEEKKEVKNEQPVSQKPPSKEPPKEVPVQEELKRVQLTPKTTLPGKKETRQRMTMVRKVIAERLVESKNRAAMLTSFNEADLTQVISLRETYQEAFQKKHGVKLGFMSFFVKAAVEALKKVPQVNSYIDKEEVVTREYFDIGIAVSTDKGVIVPVVQNADKLSFAEIEKQIETYAKKAREGRIAIDDLQGGGFTITNGGVFGSLFSTPILVPSQSGILGMHKIEKRPVVIDDQIVIRPMMYLALSYDHRLIDGKEAVTFLVSVKNCIEDPSRSLLDV